MSSTYRIAVGGILTECNHLGGIPIDMQTYKASELFRGEELFQLSTSVVGGMLATLNQEGAIPIPLLYASACAGGPITSNCYQELRGELLERLQAALPVDGVLMPIHGSALAEGVHDPEGDMIHAVRDLVGPHVPIIATLDLHAHVTQEMVEFADALLAWETYPHCDQFNTGQRATTLLLKMLAGKCQPTMAMGKVPVLTSAIHGSTNDLDPFAELMRFAKSLESQDDVLSTSLFLIHPYMDVPDMGSGGLVITNNNMEKAIDLAGEIATRYWDRRNELEPEIFSPAEAIRQGLAIEGGPVILVETADCCGGGAAGDSIATLSALVDSDVDQLSLVPLVDPEAAAQCHKAGTGATVSLPLGHKLDPRWGQTREFTGKVEQLSSDGQFVYTGGQWEGHEESMGQTALLSIGTIRVLIMSRATYDWSDEQFQALGIEAANAKFVVAKNPMNYRLAYGKLAKKMIVLDTPGPTPATLRHVQFKEMKRPYFPADVEVAGLKPTILQRGGL
ncbi:MAG: M81 family metallopeptidase [Pirellulaceae bacterium]|nr:M81 family metallopeptidase [Pirellulaceae bacterium]